VLHLSLDHMAPQVKGAGDSSNRKCKEVAIFSTDS